VDLETARFQIDQPIDGRSIPGVDRNLLSVSPLAGVGYLDNQLALRRAGVPGSEVDASSTHHGHVGLWQGVIPRNERLLFAYNATGTRDITDPIGDRLQTEVVLGSLRTHYDQPAVEELERLVFAEYTRRDHSHDFIDRLVGVLVAISISSS
jgi:hypothetical protein